MDKQFIIRKMKVEDIKESVEIWIEQHKNYCCENKNFHTYWQNNTMELEKFLERKVKSNSAYVAVEDNEILGYLAYDEFPFNGEKSVFCPIAAHAAVKEHKERVYLSLYRMLSQEWVNRDIFNHMWTIYFNDTDLRNTLFDLGYGSYLIDAFTCPHNTLNSKNYSIKKAEAKDVEVLYELVEESREYYRSSPLFLKRDILSKEEILDIIKSNNVFIAWDKEMAIGFINVSISEENNIIDMSVSKSGLIDEIGAYIKQSYRGKGIGKALVNKMFDYCSVNNIANIHVDFETANLYGNKFWRNYFDPMLLSMRRTINKNINDNSKINR